MVKKLMKNNYQVNCMHRYNNIYGVFDEWAMGGGHFLIIIKLNYKIILFSPSSQIPVRYSHHVPLVKKRYIKFDLQSMLNKPVA